MSWKSECAVISTKDLLERHRVFQRFYFTCVETQSPPSIQFIIKIACTIVHVMFGRMGLGIPTSIEPSIIPISQFVSMTYFLIGCWAYYSFASHCNRSIYFMFDGRFCPKTSSLTDTSWARTTQAHTVLLRLITLRFIVQRCTLYVDGHFSCCTLYVPRCTN